MKQLSIDIWRFLVFFFYWWFSVLPPCGQTSVNSNLKLFVGETDHVMASGKLPAKKNVWDTKHLQPETSHPCYWFFLSSPLHTDVWARPNRLMLCVWPCVKESSLLWSFRGSLSQSGFQNVTWGLLLEITSHLLNSPWAMTQRLYFTRENKKRCQH